MSFQAIQLPPQRDWVHPNVVTSRYCSYHQAPRHDIFNCFQFWDWVYDINNEGRINWSDVKISIANLKKSNQDLGIVQNPLPTHQQNKDLSSLRQNEQVNTVIKMEPRVLKRTQMWSVKGLPVWYGKMGI